MSRYKEVRIRRKEIKTVLFDGQALILLGIFTFYRQLCIDVKSIPECGNLVTTVSKADLAHEKEFQNHNSPYVFTRQRYAEMKAGDVKRKGLPRTLARFRLTPPFALQYNLIIYRHLYRHSFVNFCVDFCSACNASHCLQSDSVLHAELWSRSRKEFLGGVGVVVRKNVPTPTLTSV
jgi:hypothetical protein